MNEPQARLISFLTDVREDLQLAVDDYSFYAPEELLALQEDVMMAWSDLRVTYDAVLEQVAAIDPGLLREHGLSGPQLAIKLGAWERIRRRTRQEWSNLRSRVGRVPKGIVRRLFGLAQVILGSLRFIPGIDVIMEFKGTLEEIAESAEDQE